MTSLCGEGDLKVGQGYQFCIHCQTNPNSIHETVQKLDQETGT